ncbi:MAG: hypothetical protein R2716_10430 [Microthrixaceae bacterium]
MRLIDAATLPSVGAEGAEATASCPSTISIARPRSATGGRQGVSGSSQ